MNINNKNIEKMYEENTLSYSLINIKHLKKSPILRVQQKKANKSFMSKSTKNINRNFFNLYMPKNSKNTQKMQDNQIKKYLYRNRLKNNYSSTYFPKYQYNYANKLKKKNDGKNIIHRNYITKDKNKNMKLNNFNEKNKTELDIDLSQQDLYCINCINKIKNLDNNISKIMRRNNSFDFSFQENLALKHLDEQYINNKIIQNQQRQLAAFNQLKKFKERDSLPSKTKLQYIYENSEYPFHGLKLQDYLYYKNKKRNESINQLILQNISSYKLTEPRKEISDYYNKVMYQTPLLEKDTRPSNKYKMKYLKTLQKEIDESYKLKKLKKKEEQKKEKEELNKYYKLVQKIDAENKHKKAMKQNLFSEYNNNIKNIKKEQDKLKRSNAIHGYRARLRKFNERANEYQSFINRQRINEMNNLQNWINESLKQKKEEINKKNKEDQKWKKYNKEFNEFYDKNTLADKCAECNLVFTTYRLYPLPA